MHGHSFTVMFISQITELSELASGSNEYMNNSVSLYYMYNELVSV